jgi:hypothetical protein
MGIVYFNSNSGSTISLPVPGGDVATKPADNKKNTVDNNGNEVPGTEQRKDATDPGTSINNTMAANDRNKRNGAEQKKNNEAPVKDVVDNEVVLIANLPLEKVDLPEETKVKDVTPVDALTSRTINVAANEQFVNIPPVTSSSFQPLDNTGTPDNGDLASNEKKGSVKGFLRKATRMIEKRTGIDATNDDGRLLIGAVALKLK